MRTTGQNNVPSEESLLRHLVKYLLSIGRGLNNDPKSTVGARLFSLLQQPRGPREHGTTTLSRSISSLSRGGAEEACASPDVWRQRRSSVAAPVCDGVLVWSNSRTCGRGDDEEPAARSPGDTGAHGRGGLGARAAGAQPRRVGERVDPPVRESRPRHVRVAIQPWYAQAPWAGSGGAGPRRFDEAPGVLPRFDLFLSCGPGPRPWRGEPAPWRGGEMALALARLLPGVGVASSPVWDAASGDVHLAMRR